MGYLGRLSLEVLSLSFFSWPAFSGNADYSTFELNEIKPATLQRESMTADSPRGRPFYDAGDGDLWAVGEGSLWRWNLVDLAVTRLALPPSAEGAFQLLDANSKRLVGIDKRQIWIFDHSVKTWKKSNSQLDGKCLLTNSQAVLMPNKTSYFLFSACGGYIVASDGTSASLFRFPQSIAVDVSSAASGADREGDYVLVPEKERLLRLRLNGGSSGVETVYKAKSFMRGVARSGKNFFSWTSKAIVVLDETLRRRQVVPVMGERKLVAFGAEEGLHGMIFEDGTVEIMDLNLKKKWFSKALPKKAQHVDFIENGNMVVLSFADAAPRVFRVTIR